MENYQSLAIGGLDALVKDYSAEGVRKYFATDVIQHNPGVPTGIEPLLGILPAFKESGISHQNRRIFQDGDLVVMHNTFKNAAIFGAPEVVTFDVYRVEDGKIAEHWDAIAPIVAETANGRTQFDGPSQIKDLDKTEANKALIASFMEDVLLGKNPGKISEYISQETYHQHNPDIKDGFEGLMEALNYLGSIDDMFKYKKVHKVLGQGNFVLTMSEGEWHGKPQVFYDLFRIEDGKLVEHWDVIQEIPAEQAHTNGMF